MPKLQIFAGSTRRVVIEMQGREVKHPPQENGEPTPSTFKPWFAEAVPGQEHDSPVFEIRCMTYWEWDEITASAVVDVGPEHMRKVLKVGLVSIDGDAEQVSRFIESPAPKMCEPIYQAILDLAAGN